MSTEEPNRKSDNKPKLTPEQQRAKYEKLKAIHAKVKAHQRELKKLMDKLDELENRM